MVKAIQDEAISAVQEKFSKETGDLQKTISVLEDMNKSLEDTNTKFSERLADLEKQNAIRREQDLRSEASYMFASKLESSEIPERLHDKVMKQVSYEKFIKDGNLEKEAFSKAIEDEIKDWIDRGISSSVIGSGVSTKSVDDTHTKMKAQEAEDDAVVARMLASAGIQN